VLGEELENDLPYNDYYAYYGPDFSMHFGTSTTMENANSRQYIDTVKQQVLENLRMLQAAPGVQLEQMPDMHEPSASEPESRAQHPAEHFDGPSDNAGR